MRSARSLGGRCVVGFALGSVLVLGACFPPPKATPSPTGRPVTMDELRDLYNKAEQRIDGQDIGTAVRIANDCTERATQAEVETPGRVFPPYYRAMCESVQVRGKLLGAPKTARALERDGQEALRRDETFDQGGPLRLLGMFYLRAPRFPRGPGDPDKGTQLLQRAREKFPNHPLNRLFYAEALVSGGEHAKARPELDALRQLQLEPKWKKLFTRLLAEAEK